MDRDNLLFFYSWFNNYVKGFYSEEGSGSVQLMNDSIKHKEEHTLRVCKNIVLIGQSIGLSGKELELAEASALFHDIGRFAQFKTYGTFDDSKSDNHALLGIKILEENNVFSCLSEYEKRLIYKTVEYHNIREIPLNESSDCRMFSKLVRDADKLDIMDFFIKYYETHESRRNPSLEIDLSDKPEYSLVFIEDLLNCRVSKYSNLRTCDDMKLFRLSWLFDINFDYTLSCIIKNRYLEKTIKSLPDTKDIRRVYAHLSNYLNQKILE